MSTRGSRCCRLFFFLGNYYNINNPDVSTILRLAKTIQLS